MKLFRLGLLVIVGLIPLSVSAAIIQVDFAGDIVESYDINFDDITGTYTTMEGVFYIDTSTADSGFGNYPGAVFGLQTFRDGTPLLFQDDFTCGGSCANDVFVSATEEANVYVQDFFVGNMNLNLIPASGVEFSNDIGIFLAAANGTVGDYFDIFNSEGSIQVEGEDYFSLFYLTMTDVSAVPIPAAAWLFGSALGLLGWMRRRSA